MPWILNISYFVLLLAASPIVLYRFVVHRKYRHGWPEKFAGRLPVRTSTRPCVWFHAVSVGEVLLLKPVIRQLRARNSDCDIVITTTTSTGHAVAQKSFPEHQVCYFPLDFSWAVRNAIHRIRPTVIALVELELWPNFILAADDAGIPLLLINGRISQHSHRGYRRIRPLMRALLPRFTDMAVQSRTYAERLIDLGAPETRVRVSGSVKFDGVETDRSQPKTQQLRQAFGLSGTERIFIAGSTQSPEEEFAIDTWLAVREHHPEVRLILVPRHQERFEDVARLVEKRGLPLLRRKQQIRNSKSETRNKSQIRNPNDEKVGGTLLRFGRSCLEFWSCFGFRASDFGFRRKQAPCEHQTNEDSNAGTGSEQDVRCLSPFHAGTTVPPVLLLDTLGELSACWGLADIAFVGGSLTKRGGQNMIEPAAYGAAVLFGPNTHNFRDVVDALLSQQAARVVHNRDELTRTVLHLLDHPDEADRMGRAAQQLVLSQQGATEHTVEPILRLLQTTDSQREAA